MSLCSYPFSSSSSFLYLFRSEPGKSAQVISYRDARGKTQLPIFGSVYAISGCYVSCFIPQESSCSCLKVRYRRSVKSSTPENRYRAARVAGQFSRPRLSTLPLFPSTFCVLLLVVRSSETNLFPVRLQILSITWDFVFLNGRRYLQQSTRRET